jgi:hypothetical protein
VFDVPSTEHTTSFDFSKTAKEVKAATSFLNVGCHLLHRYGQARQKSEKIFGLVTWWGFPFCRKLVCEDPTARMTLQAKVSY